MNKNATNGVQSPGLWVNEKKWTKELMAGGWTVIPNIIVERQRVLNAAEPLLARAAAACSVLSRGSG
jgi:hypothetical protein